MVVVCERCSTRFEVDDTRIPPKGTLVRCSRCKHTFIVKAPGASFLDTVEDVVAEVTEAGGHPVPEPAEDLFDTVREDFEATGTRSSEEDWEFDDEPVRKGSSPALAMVGSERAAHPPAGTPHEEIGSPADWDLLSDSVAASAREATFIEPSAPPPPAPPPARTPARAVRPRAPELERAAPDPRVARLGRAAASAGLTGVRTIAWSSLALVLSFGVTRVVPAGLALVPPAVAPDVVGLPDGEARGVRVEFVENAFAGTLFVVEGELARGNGDPKRSPKVHWVDAEGRRLGVSEWVRPAPTPRALRERAPEALREELASTPTPLPLQGPFVAIFESVPPDATDFELALEPLPAAAPLPPSETPAAPLAAGAPGAPEPAAPTASSPPSPRPASE